MRELIEAETQGPAGQSWIAEERRGSWFAETVSGAVAVAAPEWMTPAEKAEMASVCLAAAVRYVQRRNLARTHPEQPTPEGREERS